MAVMCSLCPNGRRRFLAGAGLRFCLGNVLDWTAALLCVGRYQWSAGPNGRISHQKEIGQRPCASVRSFTGLVTWGSEHCRRVATRYDKLGANYLAFVQLASTRLWLRVNESTSLYELVHSNIAASCQSPLGFETMLPP